MANNTKSFTTVKKNIALTISIVDGLSVEGLRIQGQQSLQNGYNNLVMISSDSEIPDKDMLASIFLPASLLKTNSMNNESALKRRISAFLYDNSRLFQNNASSSSNNQLDSKILSASIKGMTISNLSPDQEMRSSFYPLNTSLSGNASCVYWNLTKTGK